MPLRHLPDLLRRPWAHVYWNARKTRWIKKGRQGRCPCLNPSDPHGPGEARCDAVIYWHRPARFRNICPLLTQSGQEWRCAGGKVGVRPFWGRALRHFAMILTIAIIVSVLAVQTLLWTTGARGITPVDLLLPTRWSRITAARGESFRRLAMEALVNERHGEVMLALASAEATAPGTNLDYSLLLLRLSEQRRQFAITDPILQDILAAYPQDRERIDLTYHDALLISGRWTHLATLCLENIASQNQDDGPWLRTLALCTFRMTDPAGFAEENAPHIQRLSDDWRAMVDTLFGTRAPDLRFDGPHGMLFATTAIQHAARLGDTALAAEALGALTTQPDPFRDLRLQNRYRLRFPGSTRDPSALRLTLVDFATTPDLLQQLLSDAIRSTAPDWLAAIAARLPQNMTNECAGDLWLAAKILGHDTLRQKAEATLNATGRIPSDYFQLATTQSHGAADWTEWITVIPCSREMLQTLADVRPATK